MADFNSGMQEKKGEFKCVSLFSGAMGLDIGLEKAGIETILCQDMERACIDTILANGYKAITGDIRILDNWMIRGELERKIQANWQCGAS